MLRRLMASATRRFRLWQGRRARAGATRLLHGPAQVRLADTEVMVTLLARNASWFLRSFLDHHLGLGAAHILVIDNGSTDDTVQICRGYERVTVLENRLPAKLHESALRSELSQRVARGGWILFADSDEMAALPIAGPDALARLTGYCNRHGYTAVLGQMLDRFSDRPQAALAGLDYAAAVRALDRYALGDMDVIAYHDRSLAFEWLLRGNICDDPAVQFRRGGMRRMVFGENPFLSKHSLVRNQPGVTPMVHPHCAAGVRVADVTLCLDHYKLAGDWQARDRASVQAGAWAHGEDARRLAATAGQGGDLRLTVANAQQGHDIDRLRAQGFLYASARFMRETAPGAAG